MALVKCSTCGKDVSTYDEACKCGSLLHRAEEPDEVAGTGALLKFTVAMGAAAFGVWYLVGQFRPSSPPQLDYELILAQQEKIKASLRDPDSVRFTDIVVSRSSGAPVVCGYVNAKNGFGGYVGKEPFISGDSADLDIAKLSEPLLEKLWPKFCGSAMPS